MRKDNFTKSQEQYFNQQARTLRGERENFASDYEFANVLSFLDVMPPAKILEIGCGTGRYTLKFLKEGFDVYGVDISSDSLEKLRHECKKKATTKWGKLKTAKSIPYNIKFDVVICINILHHLENPEEMLGNIKKCLKIGGVIFIFEPNPLYLPWYVFFAFKKILKIEKGILNSNVWKIKGMLNRKGFKNIKIKPYGLFPTRLLFWSPALVNVFSSFLPKLPLIGLFPFHNMIKANS